MVELTTEDTLLNGRVRLRQFARGYRVSIDSVILASSVPASPQDLILDAGCGVGSAMLCLAVRVPKCRIVGVEISAEAARLAAQNIAINKLTSQAKVIVAKVGPIRPLRSQCFDHIMANPPHLDKSRSRPSADRIKAMATIESLGGLEEWVDCFVALLRPFGSISIIYRADRLDKLLASLSDQFGAIIVFPLWPDSNSERPAKRVLVQARKGRKSPLRLARGLALHTDKDTYSSVAQEILRDVKSLPL